MKIVFPEFTVTVNPHFLDHRIVTIKETGMRKCDNPNCTGVFSRYIYSPSKPTHEKRHCNTQCSNEHRKIRKESA